MMPNYDPGIFFSPRNIAEAKRAILFSEAGLTTDERWELETRYIVERMRFPKSPTGLVLDYGSGIGRIARELPDYVIGVDFSPVMRQLSLRYVEHDRFTAMSPGQLFICKCAGLRFSGAYSSWVLQHIPHVEGVLDMIASLLLPGAPFYVINRLNRSIPVDGGWYDDGKDVHEELMKRFNFEEALSAPRSIFAEGSYFEKWSCHER